MRRGNALHEAMKLYSYPLRQLPLQASHSHVDAFKQHTDSPRTETKNTALSLLRNAYPDYHVTEADEYKVSLREFAAADQASLVVDAEDETFATRDWHAVGEGSEKDQRPGELKDEYRFAR